MTRRIISALLVICMAITLLPVTALADEVQEAPVSEAVQETPVKEAPAEKPPVEETSADKTPAEKTTEVKTPAEGTTVEKTPEQGTPAEKTPSEGTPAQEEPENKAEEQNIALKPANKAAAPVNLPAENEEENKEPKKFKVTLDADIPNEVALEGAGEYAAGEEVKVSAPPKAVGQSEKTVVFDKWNGDIKSNDNAFTFTMPEKDVHLTAHYKPEKDDSGEGETETFTVIYEDGADGTVFETVTHPDLAKDTPTPAAPVVPKREGYTFEGWSPEIADTVTKDVTYVAQWKENSPAEQYPFTLKFDPNGENVTNMPGEKTENSIDYAEAEDEYSYKWSFEQPAEVPVRSGYTFKGWSHKADTNDSVSWPQNISRATAYNTFNHEYTVYAIWEENKTAEEYPFTLKFDPNGENVTNMPGAQTEKSINHAEAEGEYLYKWSFEQPAEIPVRSGYTFKGWSHKADTNDSVSWPQNISRATAYNTFNHEYTVYAIWEENKTAEEYPFTLKFDPNGENVTNMPSAQTEKSINHAEEEGKYLYKWSFEKPAEVPVRSGYTFKGWSHKADTNDSVSWPQNISRATAYNTFNHEYTVYAIWEENKTAEEYPFTLKFDPNGENVTNMPGAQTEKSINHAEAEGKYLYKWSFEKPTEIPVRSGYTFKGWSYKDSENAPVSWPQNISRTTAYNPANCEATVYAVWEKDAENTFILDYHKNTSSTAHSMPDDEEVTTAETSHKFTVGRAPWRYGHVFKGWNTQADGKGKWYKPGKTVTLKVSGTEGGETVRMDLYAIWEHTSNPKWDDNPKTGDNIMFAAAVLVFSVGALMTLAVVNKTSKCRKEKRSK